MVAAEVIERQVARRGEEKCFWRLQFPSAVGAQDAEKRLLHHVVDVEALTKTPDQPRAEHRLMALNVFGKPTDSLGVLRHEGFALFLRIDLATEKTSLGFETPAKVTGFGSHGLQTKPFRERPPLGGD